MDKTTPRTYFGHLTPPQLIDAAPVARCTRRATSLLPHSIDTRPVAMATTIATGAVVYLCAGCLAALRAERFAALWGHFPASEGQLAALCAVLCAPAGYEPPGGSTDRIVRIWHGLRQWELRGVVRRIRRPAADDAKRAIVLFAARDACPDCLGRDGKHGDDCALTFGEAFAERQEKTA